MTEYIDREKAENAINLHRCDTSRIEEAILHIPSADVIPIPEGVTNGDVAEKIFGKNVYCTLIRMMYLPCCKKLKEWWNAPYERESEE